MQSISGQSFFSCSHRKSYTDVYRIRDRRKLTFYFKADKRVDFRDLTKENFRIFKSRIWMSMVSKDGELP